MKLLAVAIFLLGTHYVSAGLSSSRGEEKVDVVKEKEWWETASIYQIYPRSYKDSNGDGIGDLNGITSNLQHLKDSGIEATWLSPIFKSPMADFGYDISDFRDIQDEYGTLEDFDKLIEKAKDLDIKIILDFVPNHSSDEHDWFIKSANVTHPEHDKYKDYYVWRDPLKDANNNLILDSEGNKQPPNNWVSVFSGPAWTFVESRQQFYLHQFDKKQPDLNYEIDVVKREMEDVLTFWLEKGIYGFRVDAIPHLIEDQGFKNEKVTGDDPNDYGYTEKEFTKDQDKLYDIVSDWRNLVDAFTESSTDKIPRILMTEAYTSVENTMKYFGSDTRKGAQVPFNFFLINDVKTSSEAKVLKNAIETWTENAKGKTANWVIGNHDQGRVATRAGPPARADGFNMLVRLLPGLGVTYQGEEIAMEDVYVPWDLTMDPQACNGGKQGFELRNRDRARTPFQWDATDYAGFTDGNKTWLPVAPDFKYGNRNLAAQKAADISHYKVFQKLSTLRKTKTAIDGDLTVKAIDDEVFAFTRTLKDEKTIAFVFNLGSVSHTVDLGSEFKDQLPENMAVYVSDVNSHRKENNTVAMKDLELKGYEAIVFYGSSASAVHMSFLLMATTLIVLLRNMF